MAELVFSAAGAAAPSVSSASPASAEREFGAVPYERVLTAAECAKLPPAARKLARLDAFVHVWVHDARTFRHGNDSGVSPFSLRLHPSLPVAELRDMIQEKFTALSDYREECEGHLSLLFDGRVLESNKPFAEYLEPAPPSALSKQKALGAKRTTWPKPFAGIVWVIPFRPQRTTAVEWAS